MQESDPEVLSVQCFLLKMAKGQGGAYLPLGPVTHTRHLNGRETVAAVGPKMATLKKSWRGIQRRGGTRPSFRWSNRALHLAQEGVVSRVRIVYIISSDYIYTQLLCIYVVHVAAVQTPSLSMKTLIAAV